MSNFQIDKEVLKQYLSAVSNDAMKKEADSKKFVVTVAIFREKDDNLEILLEKRAVDPEAHEWSLPGGHVDKIEGKLENYKTAAIREIKEETGLNLSPDDLVYVCENERDSKRAKRDVFYLCKIPVEKSKEKAGSDAEGLAWVNIHKIPRMVFDHNFFVEKALQKLNSSKPHDEMTKGLPNVTNRGLLIVFEGIDGSGKTSQVDMIKKLIESRNYDVVSSKWSSSDILKKTIKKCKKEHELPPLLYSLLHASDMVWRYENDILPALAENKIVICDRYYYTSFVRDKLRGTDTDLLNGIYKSFRKPDILLYFKPPLKEAFKRCEYKGFSYYGTGMDLHLNIDSDLNCQQYQKAMFDLYNEFLQGIEICKVIDAAKGIDDVTREIWDIISPILKQKYGF
jgi:dTMP kinase